jgi:MazG family protein
MKPLEHLLSIMARLRDPKDGCEWDLRQTYATLPAHTIEEAYEVEDAVQRKDYGDLKEELGDLLFQIVFYCQLASEDARFNFDDVVLAISEKMISRHPHVFNLRKIRDGSDSDGAWESTKNQERSRKSEANSTGKPSALDGVATTLPALSRALKLQKRASMVGFDWPNVTPVLEKILEEINEVEEVLADNLDAERLTDEIGDVLFACTNLARHCNIDPETALRAANRKFEQRFRHVEGLIEANWSSSECCLRVDVAMSC